MKTKSAKKEEVARRWYVVDAEGKTLGRMATTIASVLRGKHKPDFTPHTDTGDFVIVINAAKVKLTGKKEENKMYHYHTGWAGHVVSRNAATLRASDATEIVDLAVKGMLPKTTLGRHMFDKLKVYAGPEHPHAAQKPEPLTI